MRHLTIRSNALPAAFSSSLPPASPGWTVHQDKGLRQVSSLYALKFAKNGSRDGRERKKCARQKNTMTMTPHFFFALGAHHKQQHTRKSSIPKQQEELWLPCCHFMLLLLEIAIQKWRELSKASQKERRVPVFAGCASCSPRSQPSLTSCPCVTR